MLDVNLPELLKPIMILHRHRIQKNLIQAVTDPIQDQIWFKLSPNLRHSTLKTLKNSPITINQNPIKIKNNQLNSTKHYPNIAYPINQSLLAPFLSHQSSTQNMADLLNTTAPLSSELSMILQLLSLGVLVIGFIVVKRKNYQLHGGAMFAAGVLNIVSILVVMIPVAFRLLDTSIPGFNLLFRSHILLGVVVIGLAGYILVDWRFQKPGPTCFQRKKWMLGLSLGWMAQVIIGILLFLKLYQI